MLKVACPPRPRAPQPSMIAWTKRQRPLLKLGISAPATRQGQCWMTGRWAAARCRCACRRAAWPCATRALCQTWCLPLVRVACLYRYSSVLLAARSRCHSMVDLLCIWLHRMCRCAASEEGRACSSRSAQQSSEVVSRPLPLLPQAGSSGRWGAAGPRTRSAAALAVWRRRASRRPCWQPRGGQDGVVELTMLASDLQISRTRHTKAVATSPSSPSLPACPASPAAWPQRSALAPCTWWIQGRPTSMCR